MLIPTHLANYDFPTLVSIWLSIWEICPNFRVYQFCVSGYLNWITRSMHCVKSIHIKKVVVWIGMNTKISLSITAWKVSVFEVLLVRIFRIRTDYGEMLRISLHMQSECRKKKTRKTSSTHTFHAVMDKEIFLFIPIYTATFLMWLYQHVKLFLIATLLHGLSMMSSTFS